MEKKLLILSSKIKEYVLDDKSYLEISYLVDNKVHHIQVCEGYEPHFTVFDWISKEQYDKILQAFRKAPIVVPFAVR